MTRIGRGWSGGGLPFFRGPGLLSGGHLASTLIGFVAFAVLARRLAREDYGAVEYVVGLSLFVERWLLPAVARLAVARLARSAVAGSAA